MAGALGAAFGFSPQVTVLACMELLTCESKPAGDYCFFKRAWKSLQGRLGGSQLHHAGTGKASHCLAFSKLAFLLPLLLSPWCSSPGQAASDSTR